MRTLDGAGPDLGWEIVERSVLSAAMAVASIGLSALTLGMFGSYSLVLSLLVAAPLVAGGCWAVWRSGPAPPRPTLAPLVLVVLLVLMLTVYWAMRPSQYWMVDRDPGSYTTTAVHLAASGGLTVDQTGTPFDDQPALDEGATYLMAPGVYEFQFNHLLSAVMAPALDVGGPRLMFRVPALLAGLGLLSLYLVAVRVTRRAWLAVAVPAVIGASMPLLQVARDTFSESLTLLLLWSGCLAGLVAVERLRGRAAVPVGLVAGWLLGATVAARVDSLLYLIALVPLVIIWAAWPGLDRRWRLLVGAAFALGAFVPVLIGQVDLNWFTGRYAGDLASNTRMLRLGVLAAAVVGAVVALVGPRQQPRLEPVRPVAALGAASTTGGVLLFLWFVRPLIPQRRQESPVLTGYLAAEGMPVDATRSYHEGAFVWMEWYLGPVVVTLALVGFAWMVHRTVTGRARPGELVILALGLVAGLLYWWTPNISADHPWASRRYVPAVYPAATIAAVFAAARIVRSLERAGTTLRRVAGVLVVVAMVLPAAATTWPVRAGRSQSDYLQIVVSTCDAIGSDSAVVTLELQQPRRVAPGLRAWCEVPTITLDAPEPDALRELSAEWAARGRTLWVVSELPDLVLDAVPDASPEPSSAGRGGVAIERTVTRVPQRYRDNEPRRVWMAEVPPP